MTKEICTITQNTSYETTALGKPSKKNKKNATNVTLALTPTPPKCDEKPSDFFGQK